MEQVKNPSSGKKKRRKKHKWGAEENVLVGTFAAILIIAVTAVGIFASYQKSVHAYAALAQSGERLASLTGVGAEGIDAVVTYISGKYSETTEQAQPQEEPEIAEEPQEPVMEEPAEEETPQQVVEVVPEDIDVSVSCISIDRDLKIKFINQDTEKTISGYAFEIVLTDPDGKEKEYTDEDKDGVIYITELDGGNYKVLIRSMFGFTFPEEAQQVVVKETIEYVVINVIDEVKTEAEINVAEEDAQATGNQEVIEEESVLADTVEWVASTSKQIYKEVQLTTIPEITARTVAQSESLSEEVTSFANAELTLTGPSTLTTSGNSLTLNASAVVTPAEGAAYTYGDISYTWTVSGENVTPAEAVSGSSVTVATTAETETTATVSLKVSSVRTVTETSETITAEYTTGYTVTLLHTEAGTGNDNTGTDPVEALTLPTELDSAWLTFDKASISLIPDSTSEDTSYKTSVLTASLDSTLLTEGLELSNVTYAWALSDATNLTLSDAAANHVTLTAAGTLTQTTSVTLTLTVTADVTQTTLPTNTASIAGSKTMTVTLTPRAIASIAVLTDAAGTAAKTLTITDPATTFTPVVVATYNDATTGSLSNTDLTWTTDKPLLATVSAAGVITALSDGTAIITASYAAAGATPLTATFTVTIPYDAHYDTDSLLVDEDGNQVYVIDESGDGTTYRKAVAADYYTSGIKYYIKAMFYTGWQTLDNNQTYYFTKTGEYVTGTQVIQGVSYNFTSDGYLQMNSAAIGIDVSSYQGTINWTQVKNSGVNYAIIRAGYRGYGSAGTLVMDSKFEYNVRNAAANGIKVGIYFFSQATTEAEAVEEASLVINLLNSYGIGKYVSYPIFIDTEYGNSKHTGRADSLSVSQRTAVCRAFCETIKSAGYKAGVYANKNFMESKLDMTQLNSYTLWLAQYATSVTYKGRYDLWQYSSKGSVGGISGNVDMDYSYLSY